MTPKRSLDHFSGITGQSFQSGGSFFCRSAPLQFPIADKSAGLFFQPACKPTHGTPDLLGIHDDDSR
jgi:hypothetical protein